MIHLNGRIVSADNSMVTGDTDTEAGVVLFQGWSPQMTQKMKMSSLFLYYGDVAGRFILTTL